MFISLMKSTDYNFAGNLSARLLISTQVACIYSFNFGMNLAVLFSIRTVKTWETTLSFLILMSFNYYFLSHISCDIIYVIYSVGFLLPRLLILLYSLIQT
jgi:hypothetical protein